MCTKILCQYFYIAHYFLKHYGKQLWLTNLTTKPTLNRSSYFKLQNSPISWRLRPAKWIQLRDVRAF